MVNIRYNGTDRQGDKEGFGEYAEVLLFLSTKIQKEDYRHTVDMCFSNSHCHYDRLRAGLHDTFLASGLAYMLKDHGHISKRSLRLFTIGRNECHDHKKEGSSPLKSQG